MCPAEVSSSRLHRLERSEERHVIVLQAARIVEDDKAEARQLPLDGEDLVRLLLILGDDNRDLGMIEDIDEFGSDRVLIDRHCDTTQALRSELRPVEPRPIVTDDSEQISAAKSVRCKPRREVAHL